MTKVYLSLKLCFIAVMAVFANGVSSIDTSMNDVLQKPETMKPFEKVSGTTYFNKGNTYLKNEEYEEAIISFKKSFHLSLKEKKDSLAFQNLKTLGQTYFWISEYDSSLLYLHQAMDFEMVDNFMTTADSVALYRSFGNTYYYIGQIEKAYEYRNAIIELTKHEKDTFVMADNMYSLAELDVELGKLDEAFEKLNSAYKLYRAIDDTEGISYCFDMMGNISFKKKQYKVALFYFNQTCEYDLKSESTYHEAYCYNNLGETYLKLKEFDKAKDYLNKALLLRESSEQKEEAIETRMAIAELHAARGRCEKAQRLLNECLQDPFSQKIMPLKRDIYKRMYEVNYECGNFKQAFNHQKKYFELRDSITSERIKSNLSNLSTIHELEKNKHELNVVKKEKELVLLKKEKELSQVYNGIILSVLVILVVFVVFGMWLLKKQYQYNSKLKDQKTKITEQNEKLFETNDKLKTANGELENFAYIASHDLKAPLRTIGSYTSLLKRRYAKHFDEDGLSFLEFIRSGVAHTLPDTRQRAGQ